MLYTECMTTSNRALSGDQLYDLRKRSVRMFDQVYASASFDFRFAVEPVTEETITFVPSLFYQRKNVSFKVAFPVRAYPDDNFWYRWAMITYFAGQF